MMLEFVYMVGVAFMVFTKSVNCKVIGFLIFTFALCVEFGVLSWN